MIGFISTSITVSLNYNQWNAIADLHNLQFTVVHELGFLVSISRLLATDLNAETVASNHCEVFSSSVTLYFYVLRTRSILVLVLSAVLYLLTYLRSWALKSCSFYCYKVKFKVTLRLTVSQSVSLGADPHLGIMTRYLLLFDSYGLVFLGRPLWREDGSIFCICCCPSPA
jgi:hypothetical protein